MFFNSFFRYFLYLTGTKFILAPMILPKNKDDDFRPTEKWGVNVYNQSIDEPDYRIISMKEYNRHYLYELEKIIK